MQIIELLEQSHKDKSIKIRETCLELIQEILHKITNEILSKEQDEIIMTKHFILTTTLNNMDYINDDDLFLKSIARVRTCL